MDDSRTLTFVDDVSGAEIRSGSGDRRPFSLQDLGSKPFRKSFIGMRSGEQSPDQRR